MGDDAPLRHGRRSRADGLEFVGAPKRSRFKQYGERYRQPANAALPQSVAQAAPVQQTPVAHAHQTQHQTIHQQAAHSAQFSAAQPVKAQPFVAQPVDVDESAFAEPIAAELETMAPDGDDDLPIVKLKHPNKETDKQNRRSRARAFFFTIVVVGCFAILGVSGLYLYNNQPLLSRAIKKQAGFPLFAPVTNSLFTVNKGSVKNGDNGSIVYNMHNTKTKAYYIVSQQKLPDVVKDDAQYMQFLGQIDKFADFSSTIGKAYLTKPANTGDDVTVVVKNNTTLMFIRGTGTTTEEEWSALLAYMKVDK
jgi:hypothetical protein